MSLVLLKSGQVKDLFSVKCLEYYSDFLMVYFV